MDLMDSPIKPVVLIRDIFVRIRIRGSLLLTTDPDADPDPALFVSDLQGSSTNILFNSCSAYYFLRVFLHNFSMIKSQSQNSQEPRKNTDTDPDPQHCFSHFGFKNNFTTCFSRSRSMGRLRATIPSSSTTEPHSCATLKHSLVS